MNVQDILIKPYVTETSMGAVAKANRYTFVVNAHATKPEIKRAVERLFGVHVTNVRTVVVKGGLKKLVGARISYTTKPDWKKAVIQLKKGDSINLFEAGEEKKKKKK